MDRLHRSKNPAAIAHSPLSGRGGRRDEAGGSLRASTTSSLRRGDQSAGSGTALWDRSADGGENADVLVPPGYRRSRPPARPKLDPFLGIIDRILEEDKSQPAKQHHTAKRIFERLREMFAPLRHDPGHAQGDF